MAWVSGERRLASRIVSIACVVSAFCASAATAAGLRGDVGRIPIHAARRDLGTPLPYVGVRVGDERRYALADSDRTQLALRPAQVSPGGRVFVFARIPAELVAEAFDVEFLVWHAGRWRRMRTLPKEAGRVGHVSTTVVVHDAQSEAVATAVFRRSARFGARQSLVSTPMRVRANARLRFGFSFDEWDWSDLAPVRISVLAVVEAEGELPAREAVVFEKRVEPKPDDVGWYEAEASLAGLADRRVRFVFRADPEPRDGTLAPHVVWSAPALLVAKPARSAPSVVIIVTDGVRARSLGVYGADVRTTPFLDELFAEQGTVLDAAITQSVNTVPSLMTLLTGRYPCMHGVYTPPQTLARAHESVAELFWSAGYATAAFTDAAGPVAELGFGRGFGVYYQDSAIEPSPADNRATTVFDRAAKWIAHHADEAFFVLLHTARAKPPHIVPRRYQTLFESDQPQGDGALADYQRELRYLDDVLKTFIERLDAATNPQRTLLVVTSGLGSEAGLRSLRADKPPLYQETIHVPLLARGGGVRAGRRYAGIVGVLDVAPTVADLAGFAVPEAWQGTSIGKTLRSGDESSPATRVTEADISRTPATASRGRSVPQALAITDGATKLITFTRGGERVFEAYDLSVDRNETVDVLRAGAAPPWADKLRLKLEAYTAQCKRAGSAERVADKLPLPALFKLQALGYL